MSVPVGCYADIHDMKAMGGGIRRTTLIIEERFEEWIGVRRKCVMLGERFLEYFNQPI